MTTKGMQLRPLDKEKPLIKFITISFHMFSGVNNGCKRLDSANVETLCCWHTTLIQIFFDILLYFVLKQILHHPFVNLKEVGTTSNW